MTTTTISHARYSNLPSFAAACQEAFAGKVSILPNAEVMSACLSQGGRRAKEVEVAVLADDGLRTAYRVGGEFGLLLIIDAEDGSTVTHDLGSSDEDDEAAAAAALADLGVTA